MTREEFIRRFYPDTIAATKGSGIFPEVAIAQALVESADRRGVPYKSSLAVKYNNFFGIKADRSWKGKAVRLQTDEYFDPNVKTTIVDGFRVYNSFGESVRDYVKFLKENQRYTNAGVFKAKTPEAQIEAIKRAGYATSPTYAQTIKSIINANYNTMLDVAKKYKPYAPYVAIGLIASVYFAFKVYKLYKK
jgi:flagellum-specific peptidoglycan hydrolase FlgJ